MGAAEWYYVENGQSTGPVTAEELLARLPKLGGDRALVFGPGLANWTEARHVAALRPAIAGSGAGVPPPWTGRKADEIDYQIYGDDMQFVEVGLDPGEMVVAEAGAMMYMAAGVEMQTSFGDPSADQGLLGKVLSAGKRLLTGESMFLTTFTGRGPGRQHIAFAAPYPGKIVPIDLTQHAGEVLCQKQSFLCCARGVTIGIAFTRRLGAGVFGGEGFILQRLKGDGVAFVHAGGTLCNRQLAAGESLRVDTGCLVAFQPSVTYDIRFVGGFKNTLFGGEGLFFAELTGPGSVWLQSLPFARLVDRIHASGRFSRRTDES
ncbi:MAG: TIGR00266 family protein [Phycisphaerae bacterium]|jgi:uncharacterized protein (TIGR00266 family)|nr:TIGR00266 family protein [Phycisphaerae bacterium]MCZ2398570.1 TIGR00266 family protein [Phycisphaerae bacterium]